MKAAPRRGALVGFGHVAANGHVPTWQQRTDFALVAVCDPDPARRALAAQQISGIATYAGLADLLRDERPDFVDVATPPAYHAATVVAAAQAGAHALCEKPLTTDLGEFVAIQNAARRAGTVVHTVHNWKHSEAFRTVRSVLEQQAIGPLRHIVFDTERSGHSVTIGENWRALAAIAGGGILVDHGWHAFYLMLALANEAPRRVRAATDRRRYRDADVEDTVECTVEFPSLTGEIRLTWAGSRRRTCWRFVGENGEVTVDDDVLCVRGVGGEHRQRLHSALSAGSHHPQWFAGVVDEFRREVDRPALRGANLAEAERCLLMLRQAYASAAQGCRWLDVPAGVAACQPSAPDA
jgi:predicted dehydrogenase